MKAKTAIICAYNNENPGMYTVDLSALGFFRDTRFRLFQVEPLPRFGKIRYQQLVGIDSLHDFQHIVFWGDFQNNPLWGANDFAQRRIRCAASPHLDSARRDWVSLYLRTREGVGRDKTLMSVGTCFLGADTEDLLRRYGQDLRFLLDSFDLIVPRDPLSTEVVRRLGDQGTQAKIIEGMDPVFLGDHLPTSDGSARGQFGCFFHRSHITGTEELISAVARQSGLSPRCLRWFGLKNDLLTHWRYRRLIRQVLECEFIITDVYHLAATSLKMHVPAICIGRTEVLQRSTLGDLKKKALFASLHCDDYLETEESAVTPAFLSTVLERSAQVLSKGGLGPTVREVLVEKPKAIRKRIWSALGA
jgi:Polysaccharide pyruvyl transferase